MTMQEAIDHLAIRAYARELVGDLKTVKAIAVVIEALDAKPAADVVEVVRCKDCKFRKIEFGWNGKRYKMCANTDYPTDDDAYCSYGERREKTEDEPNEM